MSVRAGLKTLGAGGGKYESHFVGALGRPHSVKTLSSGQRLLEWRSGHFHSQMVAVLFDRDHRYVEVVARLPSTSARQSPAGSSAPAPLSVVEQLAALDLRDARVHTPERHGLWSRSPR